MWLRWSAKVVNFVDTSINYLQDLHLKTEKKEGRQGKLNYWKCQGSAGTAVLSEFDSRCLNVTNLVAVHFFLFSLSSLVPLPHQSLNKCAPRAEGQLPSWVHTMNSDLHENLAHAHVVVHSPNYKNVTQWQKHLTFHLVDWWCIHTHCGVGNWHSLQPKVFHLLLAPGLEWHMHGCNRKGNMRTSGGWEEYWLQNWCYTFPNRQNYCDFIMTWFWKKIQTSPKDWFGKPLSHEEDTQAVLWISGVSRMYFHFQPYSGHHLFCHWIPMQRFHW